MKLSTEIGPMQSITLSATCVQCVETLSIKAVQATQRPSMQKHEARPLRVENGVRLDSKISVLFVLALAS